MSETITIDGQLEIDHARGVIYFHSGTTGQTVLRICRLPQPMPKAVKFIDITHMYGVNYDVEEQER